MSRLWQRYAERVDQLSLRERIMIFAAAMTVLVAFLHTFFIDPELEREGRLSTAIAQKQADARRIQDQLSVVVRSRGGDPDRELREQLAEVSKQLAEVEALVAAEERKFTAPEQMRGVIEELLARNRAVRLQGMRSLPTTSIAETRPQPAGEAEAGRAERLIYRHGIEIVVAGTYLDLLGYLSDLERLPTQLYWSSLDLDASRHPVHTMKLIVYTLSLDRAWLNV